MGLVIIVLDSLRADFAALAARAGHALPALERLRALCVPLDRARCGSFPTVPMRTDLLTGRLAFLHRRWATPEAGDPIVLRRLAAAGVHSTLVTDNYVVALPGLGGDIAAQFDELVFVRGAGSDPVEPWDAGWIARRGPRRPARSVELEAQYVHNALGWQRAGGPPWARLFNFAERELARAATRRRFLFWLDVFSIHEPWTPADELRDGSVPADEPISPPYGDEGDYDDEALARLRRRYTDRLAEVDRAMAGFVDRVAELVRRGDIGLIVLSDHGFAFGEFGVVGKPAASPVLPPLFDLVAWVCPAVREVVPPSAGIQPHELTACLARWFGVAWPAPAVRGRGPQLLGRNSPDVPTLTLAGDRGLTLVFRDRLARGPRFFAWDKLNASRPWQAQGIEAAPAELALPPSLLAAPPAWLGEFRRTFDLGTHR